VSPLYYLNAHRLVNSDDIYYSQLEKEINEKLHDCHQKLLSADVDQKESEREARLKETFATLQRIFPGKLDCLSIVHSGDG
jgi:hypothetical protein